MPLKLLDDPEPVNGFFDGVMQDVQPDQVRVRLAVGHLLSVSDIVDVMIPGTGESRNDL